MGNYVGLAAIEAELRGTGQLLSEPRLSVIRSRNGAKEIEWIASGTWPLPWVPRFIVRGSSSVKTGSDGKVGFPSSNSFITSSGDVAEDSTDDSG